MAASRIQLENEEARDAVVSALAAVEEHHAALQSFTDDAMEKVRSSKRYLTQ